MANHKKKRAPRQRASSRGVVDFGNGRRAQHPQERRARDAEVSGWSVDDFSWLEPDGSEGDYWPPAWHPKDIPPSGPMLRERSPGRKSKPFVIEARWARPSFPAWRVWRVHRRYATEAQRAQALAQLTRVGHRHPFGPYFEFRVPEGDPHMPAESESETPA